MLLDSSLGSLGIEPHILYNEESVSWYWSDQFLLNHSNKYPQSISQRGLWALQLVL
jgi:hypothetical protein